MNVTDQGFKRPWNNAISFHFAGTEQKAFGELHGTRDVGGIQMRSILDTSGPHYTIFVCIHPSALNISAFVFVRGSHSSLGGREESAQ